MVMGAGREGGCSDEVGGGGSPRVQHEVAVMIVEFEERILSDPYPVFKSFQEYLKSLYKIKYPGKICSHTFGTSKNVWVWLSFLLVTANKKHLSYNIIIR